MRNRNFKRPFWLDSKVSREKGQVLTSYNNFLLVCPRTWDPSVWICGQVFCWLIKSHLLRTEGPRILHSKGTNQSDEVPSDNAKLSTKDLTPIPNSPIPNSDPNSNSLQMSTPRDSHWVLVFHGSALLVELHIHWHWLGDAIEHRGVFLRVLST